MLGSWQGVNGKKKVDNPCAVAWRQGKDVVSCPDTLKVKPPDNGLFLLQKVIHVRDERTVIFCDIYPVLNFENSAQFHP